MLLHQRFVRAAKEHSKKTFVIDCTLGTRITYSRALAASLLLADRFRPYGPGLIGIMIPTSAGCILSILAALTSGRTPVMINYVTGAARNVELAQKHCGFKTVLTSKALLKRIDCPTVPGMVFLEDIMESVSPLEKLRAALRSVLPASVILRGVRGGDEDDNVLILFTSGSERAPKAVQLTHRNITSNVEGLTEIYGLTSDDSILANLPYFHVFGQTAGLWIPICHGMTIVTCANPLDCRAILQALRDHRPSIMLGTPSFYRAYLQRAEPGDFASLRVAVTGAARCPDSLREAFLRKHDLKLYEAYGTTETSPAISANTPDLNRPGSVGRPLPGVRVKILDCETGSECGVGAVGRILVSGDLVMKGYLNEPEETSMRIRQGWYDTGDVGRIDEDGYLWHVGRLKRFAKVGGEMVSLMSVEAVLERLLPEDVTCCVVDMPDPVKGARIVAVVTQEVDGAALLKQMSAELPNIALPKQFFVIDDLPTMGSGKADFRAIREKVRHMLGH